MLSTVDPYQMNSADFKTNSAVSTSPIPRSQMNAWPTAASHLEDCLVIVRGKYGRESIEYARELHKLASVQLRILQQAAAEAAAAPHELIRKLHVNVVTCRRIYGRCLLRGADDELDEIEEFYQIVTSLRC